MGDQLICPVCGHAGDAKEFEVSQADECFCPNGCEWELIEGSEGDDEEQ